MDHTTRRLDLNQWKQFWQNRSTGEETNPGVLGDSFWTDSGWQTGAEIDFAAVQGRSFQLQPILFQSNGGSLPPARDGLGARCDFRELPGFPPRSATTPAAPAPPSGSTGSSTGSSAGSSGIPESNAALRQNR